MHEYYNKQVSSKAVIDAKSAMPFKDRRTMLTQDLLRILLRCSPKLPFSQKKKHIEEYVLWICSSLDMRKTSERK